MSHPHIFKAYLIDPFTQSVTEVEHNGDFREIYALLGGVEVFDCVEIENGDLIYVDDNGLFVKPAKQRYFCFDNQILAGKGLVLGYDKNGESTTPHTLLEDLVRRITYPDHAKASAYAQFVASEIPEGSLLN